MSDRHPVQMQILKTLMFNPRSRFSRLNKSDLTSDHFTYHLSVLIKLGYVARDGNAYVLTPSGKEFANTMDTEVLKIEKQPKVGVLVVPFRTVRGQEQVLIQRRLKEPYYGFWGFISGKVRFGEMVLEAAARELEEESGLSAQLQHAYLLHEHVYSRKDNKLLEDKFFHLVKATRVTGDLRNHEGGENKWIPLADYFKQDKLFYDEADIMNWLRKGEKGFIEMSYAVEEF